MRPPLSSVALMSLGLVTPAVAQQPRTAEQVVERHVAAVGGRQAFEALKARHMVAEIEMASGNFARMETFTIYPDKHLVRTNSAAGKSETVYDGRIAWSISDHSGTVLLPDKQRDQLKHSAAAKLPLQTLGRRMRLAGRHTIEGKEAIAIVVDDESGQQFAGYFDGASGLLVAIGKVLPGGGVDPDGLTIFGEYKRFGRVLLPTLLTVKLGGTKSLVTRTTHVDHGPVDTMLFVRPASVRALVAGRPH